MKKLTALILSLLLALCFTACQSAPAGAAQGGTLVVGASPAPHAQILNDVVKDLLAEQGITLEVKEFTDYVLPNTALDEGELDANYFQHTPYLNDFNAQNGTDLVPVVAVHFEPLAIYAGKCSDIAAIPDGAQIAVPNDTTNEARALQLLESVGILTLKEGAGLEATALDIEENPHNVEIVEIEAAQVPRTLPDVEFAVCNGNYALDAGILDKQLVTESPESDGAQTYANVLVVRSGDEDREDIQALVKALTSDEVRDYIETTFHSSVVPVF